MKKKRLAIILAAVMLLSCLPPAAFAGAVEPDRLPDEPAAVELPAVDAPEDDPELEPMVVPADLLAGAPAQRAPAELSAEMDQGLAAVEIPQDEGRMRLLAALDEEGAEEGSGIPAMKMDMYLGEAFAGSLYFTSSGTEATLAAAEDLTGAIKVPEQFTHEGVTYRVVKIGCSAFHNQTGLTQVWLPSGLRDIGSKAFSGCDHLKAVGSYQEGGDCDPYALPDGLTNIWPDTFYGCTRLSSVKIGRNVTDIWHYAFAYCYSLGQNYTDESGVTYGVYFDEGSRLRYIHQGAFQSCIVLDNITLPDSLENIGPNAFYQCTAIMEQDGEQFYVGLKDVAIPDGVKAIGEKAFMYCYTMDTLSIPATVETIDDKAFYSCSHLRELEFRGTGSKNIKMGTMVFYWCRMLEDIKLPANLKSLPAWTFAYAGYYGQPDVVLPEGMEEVDRYAFNESGIRSITFSSTIVKVNMLAFGDCHNLRKINWPQKGPEDDPLSLGMMAFTDCENLTELTLPKLHITSGDNLFYDCDNLRTVTIGDGSTFIPESCFRDCDALATVNLSASLETIGEQAFYSCPSLTDADLSAATGLKAIGKLAFCRTALTDVTLPASVTAIGNEAFGINRALLSFTVAENNAGGYFAENGTLYQRKTAQEIHLVRYPAGAAATTFDIPAQVTQIDRGAFSHSERLVTVTFPSTLKSIGDYAFSHCINLKNADVNSKTQQGKLVFDQCYQLASLTIPQGTTVVGGNGYNPSSLSKATTITIPKTVTAIRDRNIHPTGSPDYEVGSPFLDLPALEAIVVEEGNPNYVSVDGVVFTKDMTTLIAYPPAKLGEEYIVPDTVTTIVMNAFANASNLRRVVIPESVANLGMFAFSRVALDRMDIYRNFTDITTGGLYNTDYAKFLYDNGDHFQVRIYGDPTDPAGTQFIEDFAQCGVNEKNILIDFIRPVEKAGDRFCVDGVVYTLSAPAAKAVTVGANHNYAKSQVTIPAKVTYNGTGYTVTAVESGAFAGAAGLTAASVMLSAAQIGEKAFDSTVTVTSRDTMTGFTLNTRYLAYGDTLVVSTPASVSEGTSVTLTGAQGSVSAAVAGGTAVFPVDKALYDAVDSRGKDVTVTLAGGGVTTEGIHIMVSPKTYGPDNVPWYNPGVHTYFISKPYDGTDVVDVTTAEPLDEFLVDGDDVAIRFYNATCCYIEANPNMNDNFRGDMELVGKDASYYAISDTLKARPQDYFGCHVNFGQLYIKEVDGVLQKPLFRRVWTSEDGMRVRDCGLGGGQFVAYIPTKTEGSLVTEYETVDVDGYFVYTDSNPYPEFKDSGDFPVYAGSVYNWDFIPSGNDRQELLKNYRFSGSFMPWDPNLSKNDSDGPANNLVGEAGENPPLPGYVKPAETDPPQETDPVPAKPTQPDTTPVQDTPTTPAPSPTPTPPPSSGGSGSSSSSGGNGTSSGGSSSDGGSSSGGSSSSSGKPTAKKPDSTQSSDTKPAAALSISDKIVAQAVKNTQPGKAVVIQAPEKEQVPSAVTLTAQGIKTVSDAGAAGLTVQTALAEITLDAAALDLVQGKEVTISAILKETSDLPQNTAKTLAGQPVYEVTITSGKDTVSQLGAGRVKISIPTKEDTDLVAYRVKEDGSLVLIPTSGMVNGKLVFQVDHLSAYTFLPAQAEFSDVMKHWAKADIEFDAARRVMIGTGMDRFSPGTPITGAMAITTLGRLAGVTGPEKGPDWSKNQLAWAKEQGILPEGFDPNAPISREETAYLLSQYLGGGEDNNSALSYTDRDQIDRAYQSSVRHLQNLDLMHGLKDGSFNPKGQLTRAELAAILHRLILSELQ